MLKPTLQELNQAEGTDLNRYQMALVTAKIARQITDEYTKQKNEAEENAQGDAKLLEKEMRKLVNPLYQERLAVSIAVDRMLNNEYIVKDTPVTEDGEAIATEAAETTETEAVEATEVTEG